VNKHLGIPKLTLHVVVSPFQSRGICKLFRVDIQYTLSFDAYVGLAYKTMNTVEYFKLQMVLFE
jgi:hypothetical protein